MTKTVTFVRRSVFGNMRISIVDVDVTEYTSGGESLTASNLGLSAVEAVIPIANENNYIVRYDYTNSKLIVANPSKAQTITPTVLGSEPTTSLLQNAAGTIKSTNTTAFATATAGAGTAVTASTDCGVFRLVAMGY